MELKDFDYNLPKNLIAKTPLKKRGQSRLLIMDKDNGGFIHKQFDFLLKILRPGDTLVLNNSMVIPARLFCVDFDKKSISRFSRVDYDLIIQLFFYKKIL